MGGQRTNWGPEFAPQYVYREGGPPPFQNISSSRAWQKLSAAQIESNTRLQCNQSWINNRDALEPLKPRASLPRWALIQRRGGRRRASPLLGSALELKDRWSSLHLKGFAFILCVKFRPLALPRGTVEVGTSLCFSFFFFFEEQISQMPRRISLNRLLIQLVD